MKEENKTIIIIVTSILLVGLVLIFGSINQTVSFEGECSTDNLSFDINKTRNIENITLDEGKIHCRINFEAPIWSAILLD